MRPGVANILGEQVYKHLRDIPFEIDLVNVFRAPRYVLDVVDTCIECGVTKIWLQEGVINEKAEKKAQKAGISIIMDRCIYKEIVRLGISELNSNKSS